MINYNNTSKPELIEHNVKYFLRSTLNNCHKFKDKYFNNLFNITIFISFVLILSLFLFFNYKGNKNIQEIELQKQKDKQYIISRLLEIKQENNNNNMIKNNLITNLPLYNQ